MRPLQLQLPLRLGIAFVPAEAGRRQGAMLAGPLAAPGDPAQEQDLHRQVAELFGQKPWTLSFKTIPALYLARAGGFSDL